LDLQGFFALFCEPNLTIVGKFRYFELILKLEKSMVAVALAGVSKVYDNGVRALLDCDLTIASGEWLVLVGPSGCGKTTTLRLIAGLEQPTTGTIRIGEALVNDIPPARRDVAMVFQRPALFPNRDVYGNLAFGMRLRRGLWSRWSRSYRRHEEQAVREVAGCLGIGPLLKRRVGELSGGEQQRVALGRALVRPAAVGLLDEPLGHLDAPLRQKLRRDLPLLRGRFPATMIIVTHDPAEASALGDRIAVVRDGKILQVDQPEKIRREPRDPFVAEFFCECP
jgi:ABC-type sugar transport system ATPase subunit